MNMSNEVNDKLFQVCIQETNNKTIVLGVDSYSVMSTVDNKIQMLRLVIDNKVMKIPIRRLVFIIEDRIDEEKSI